MRPHSTFQQACARRLRKHHKLPSPTPWRACMVSCMLSWFYAPSWNEVLATWVWLKIVLPLILFIWRLPGLRTCLSCANVQHLPQPQNHRLLLLVQLSLKLPQDMSAAVGQFDEFYNTKFATRKLQWLSARGTCHVIARFDANPVELIVGTARAALLLLFNMGKSTTKCSCRTNHSYSVLSAIRNCPH